MNSHSSGVAAGLSPFVSIDRAEWAALAPSTPVPFTDADIAGVRGLGDPLDLDDVLEVYQPLSRLLWLYSQGARNLHRVTSDFLGERAASTPFIIGVAGSVAVGKSTVSRLVQFLLRRWENTPQVELITTDGFLYPNATLTEYGILERKGFPESYNRKALLQFVSDVKSGATEVKAPVYSHVSYDIVPGKFITVRQPDILIVEGLNVLQPPTAEGMAVSDLFDFSIYVDADTAHIAQWYEDRFMRLKRGAFSDPASYFHRYAALSDDEAMMTAREIWQRTNEPNLEQNIRPTRSRSTLILQKAADHKVDSVLLRKI